MEQTVITALVTLVLSMAVVTDLRSSRIPNWLTVPSMVIAMGIHTYMNSIGGLLFSLTGLGAGLGLFLLLYLMGSIGAGDVKFMAAVGAMIGPSGALISAVLAILVGGGYALGAMCFQWGFWGTGRKLASAVHGAALVGGQAWTQELALPFRLRYGLAIAGGTLLFLTGIHPFGG